MIEAKAKVDNANDSTDVRVKLKGSGSDLVNESLAVIKALMGDMRNHSRLLHAMILKEIVDDPNILLANGKDNKEEWEVEMSELMSRGILKGGMN